MQDRNKKWIFWRSNRIRIGSQWTNYGPEKKKNFNFTFTGTRMRLRIFKHCGSLEFQPPNSAFCSRSIKVETSGSKISRELKDVYRLVERIKKTVTLIKVNSIKHLHLNRGSTFFNGTKIQKGRKPEKCVLRVNRYTC